MVRGEIKPNIVHENEHALVFTDSTSHLICVFCVLSHQFLSSFMLVTFRLTDLFISDQKFFVAVAVATKPKTVVSPHAPTHLLIIPKKLAVGQVHNAQPSDANELGQLLLTAGEVAKKLDLLDGYRLVINQGLNAQQSVNYLHVHLLSGRKFTWPPG